MTCHRLAMMRIDHLVTTLPLLLHSLIKEELLLLNESLKLKPWITSGGHYFYLETLEVTLQTHSFTPF